MCLKKIIGRIKKESELKREFIEMGTKLNKYDRKRYRTIEYSKEQFMADINEVVEICNKALDEFDKGMFDGCIIDDTFTADRVSCHINNDKMSYEGALAYLRKFSYGQIKGFILTEMNLLINEIDNREFMITRKFRLWSRALVSDSWSSHSELGIKIYKLSDNFFKSKSL